MVEPQSIAGRVALSPVNPGRDWNRVVGWTTAALGVGTGLVMGLWSFDGPLPVPAWIGEYGETSRRLVRLGHIALIGLGILDILLARELPRSALRASAKRLAAWAMILGNVFLPLTLFAAAAFRPLKYFMALPASCVFVALLLAAHGARRPVDAAGRERDGSGLPPAV